MPPARRSHLCLMAKRNYKVYAELGFDRYTLTRKLSVLDTGAGPNFIRKSALTPGWEAHLRAGPLPSVNDANNKPLRVIGLIPQVVRLGHYLVESDFVVCETLAAEVIIGADYMDRFVEAILPRKKCVELADGSTVPIVRRPLARPPSAPPLPPDQEYQESGGRVSNKLRVETPVKLEPAMQTWVSVVSPRHGVMVVQPNEKLFHNHGVAPTNGVVQIEPNRPFRILVANFGKHAKSLVKNQVLGTLLPHPTFVIPTPVKFAEVLGLVNSDSENAKPEPADNTVSSDKQDLVKPEVAAASSPTKASVDDMDLSHVDEQYRNRLREMLRRHSAMWDGSLGEINSTEHCIELKAGTRPIAQQPYRAGFKEREFVATEIDKMLRSGVVEPAQSAWASPVAIVPKADGSHRFCVDYRRLNEATIRDAYPLPRMDDHIDSLGEASVFTTLDCNSGYWQIPIREEDRDKTAFTSHAGTFRFLRMPFGLTNAPATFQRTIDLILSRFRWQTCLVYLDDIIIFSKNKVDHLRHVEQVLSVMRDAGLTLKLPKCTFFTDTVKYLGHIIRPGRLEIDRARVAGLSEALPPRTKTELRSFLGVCNVYRRFVPKFAKVASPLSDMLKKGTPDPFSELDSSQLTAFNTLIKSVTEAPVLALPVSTGKVFPGY